MGCASADFTTISADAVNPPGRAVVALVDGGGSGRAWLACAAVVARFEPSGSQSRVQGAPRWAGRPAGTGAN